tara:strand:+ start:237 stop:890 length:654 start_codon:yes stop_codon:yes gene_type:complete
VKFARWLQEAWKDECPLCLQPHPVQIHTYADRTYRNPEKQENGKDYAVVSIVVPRLYCIVNHRLRKHDGKPLQYTITVLPAFLAPYSVILVDKIHQAVDHYIGQKPECCTHQEAAFKIGCDDPVSFILYFRRVKQRLSAWIVALTVLALTLGANIKQADVHSAPQTDLKGQWRWFTYLAATCLAAHGKIPGTKVIAQPLRWQYTYAVLGRRSMGLGP